MIQRPPAEGRNDATKSSPDTSAWNLPRRRRAAAFDKRREHVPQSTELTSDGLAQEVRTCSNKQQDPQVPYQKVEGMRGGVKDVPKIAPRLLADPTKNRALDTAHPWAI